MIKKVKKIENAEKVFRKAKMYKLINEHTKSETQQKVYDGILNRILKILQLPELINRIESSSLEKKAYDKYIKPLIEGEKEFSFVTGIFFASLITLIAPSASNDEFMDDLTRNKLARDILSDDWITKIEDYEMLFVDLYLESEYEEYQNKRNKERNKINKIDDLILRDKKHREITKKYDKDKDTFKKELQKKLEHLGMNFHILNTICYHLVRC